VKKRKNIFNLRHIVSSVLMLLALAWLTVSLPYVYASQKAQKEHNRAVQSQAVPEEETCNPFANTTEEKTEGGVNTLSEYLHDMHQMAHHYVIIDKYYKGHLSNLYFAFHPDLLSPPPEA
jgi:hypothetical protein